MKKWEGNILVETGASLCHPGHHDIQDV